MEVGEAHAFSGQVVENGRLDGAAIATEVAVAEVVDEQSDDIRAFILGKTGTNQKQEAKKCKDGFQFIF